MRDQKLSGIMKGLQAQIRWNHELVSEYKTHTLHLNNEFALIASSGASSQADCCVEGIAEQHSLMVPPAHMGVVQLVVALEDSRRECTRC